MKNDKAGKSTKKADKDKKIIEQSNLIMQRNIDVYKRLAANDQN